MTLLQALILGIVQGLTEFIPVSSTAHLVLVPWWLGWSFEREAEFAFDVLVQWGTLLAVVVYFWHDLIAMACAVLDGLRRRQPLQPPLARLAWLVVLATLPAVVVGFTLKNAFELVYDSPLATAALLLGTATLLVLSEQLLLRLPRRELESLGWFDALVIGLAQALALLPGISRSGATISGGLTRGLARPAAARFSFLMSIPALLGAGVLTLGDLFALPNFEGLLLPLFIGFVAAAVVGYAAIRWLLAYLARHSLYIFAAYCALVAVASLGLAAIASR